MPSRSLNVSQRASIRDGMWHAAMLGSGETYLIPFAVAIGASTIQVGFLSSFPQLFGAISQLVSLYLMNKMQNRARFCSQLAVLQALVWVPLALLSYVHLSTDIKVNILIFITTIYFVVGNVVNPVWNSLFGDIAPPASRGWYIGYRNKWIGVIVILSLILSGIILEQSQHFKWYIDGFTILFSASFLFRIISAYWLNNMEEPGYSISHEDKFTFWQFVGRASDSNFVKFVLFVAIFNLSIAVAGPFFTIYLLRDVQLSYFEFMIVSCGLIAAQFLTMQHWGRLVDQFGAKRLLNFAGIGLSVVPFLWLISSAFWYLLLLQIYSGFVTAGYILSTTNFIFDAVSPPKRARCIAFQAVINGLAVFAGTLIGGLLAKILPTAGGLQSPFINNSSNLLIIFLLSGLVRLIILVFLTSFKEVRDVKNISNKELIFMVSYLRPIRGFMFNFSSIAVEIDGSVLEKTQKINDIHKDG